MGKKSGRGGEKKGEESAKAKAFLLKVAMHCHCNGCIGKIRAAVQDITLLPGIEAVEQSALESKGEVKLVATADPEKLRQRLRKATHKNVDLILPKETKADKANKDDAAAAAQALLVNSLQQAQYGQGAWANQLLTAGGGGGWNTHQGSYGYGAAGVAQAYPWAAQQPDPYAAAYPAAAGAWGAYAYPPAQGHGAYGGGAWYGHGY
ncbi:heavy metal-associated isoprenylated plant protein 3-like [Phragmites australis]|uniref:heavy metal-associated isoprenylated plant protein 3-like n=1 Tax=Phragmites australis TaxID=29695 RepID=UPI002D787AE6|nr:heavy metal-associated isoprenylated plant protein 3-like [Phragmites australis]